MKRSILVFVFLTIATEVLSVGNFVAPVVKTMIPFVVNEVVKVKVYGLYKDIYPMIRKKPSIESDDSNLRAKYVQDKDEYTKARYGHYRNFFHFNRESSEMDPVQFVPDLCKIIAKSIYSPENLMFIFSSPERAAIGMLTDLWKNSIARGMFYALGSKPKGIKEIMSTIGAFGGSRISTTEFFDPDQELDINAKITYIGAMVGDYLIKLFLMRYVTPRIFSAATIKKIATTYFRTFEPLLKWIQLHVQSVKIARIK